VTPSAKREVVEVLIHERGVAVRRACQAVRLSRRRITDLRVPGWGGISTSSAR